jgi:hypothetical protein
VTPTDPQPDLLAPLGPDPADVARPVGLMEGPAGWMDRVEAEVAQVRVWCGVHGWRGMGELRMGVEGRGVPILLLHEGRLTIGLTFDLGAAKLPRRGVLAGADPEA